MDANKIAAQKLNIGPPTSEQARDISRSVEKKESDNLNVITSMMTAGSTAS